MNTQKHVFYGAEGRYVAEVDFDRVTAERDALQQLLNARDEEVEGLRKASSEIADALHQMTIRAIAAEELIDVCDCSNISEPTPVECHHEWIDDGLHIEVCVLCGKEENFEEKPENQA